MGGVLRRRHVVHGWVSVVRAAPMPPGGPGRRIIEASARGRGMALWSGQEQTLARTLAHGAGTPR